MIWAVKFLKITFDEHQTSTNVGEDEVIRKYAEIDYISTSHKNIYMESNSSGHDDDKDICGFYIGTERDKQSFTSRLKTLTSASNANFFLTKDL